MLNHSSTYNSSLFGFTGTVGDLAHHEIKIIDYSETLLTGLKLLTHPQINYLVVMENGVPKNILSQEKVIEADKTLDSWIPLSKLKYQQIISVTENAKVLDTLLYLINHNLQYVLVVNKNNQPIGIVKKEDWLSVQTNYPVELIKKIVNCKSLDEIVLLRKKSKTIIWENFEREKNTRSLTNIITLINNAIVKQVLTISIIQMNEAGKGQPPVKFAWIGMGSEGRKAQTIRTDQDNGIIFENVSHEKHRKVKVWFLDFAEIVVHYLEKCGFPLCEGNIMANNPKLCESLENWQKNFDNIIYKADVKELLEASIYFDFRCIYGETYLTQKLWNHLFKSIENRPIFKRFFAENILQASRPPIQKWQWKLPVLMGVIPPKFDIKREALAPLDAAVRLLAIHHKISVTSTIERIDELLKRGAISKVVAGGIQIAFDFILKLRFRLEFTYRTEIKNTNHSIDIKQLSTIEIQNLKDALLTIYNLQDFVYQQITKNKVPWLMK